MMMMGRTSSVHTMSSRASCSRRSLSSWEATRLGVLCISVGACCGLELDKPTAYHEAAHAVIGRVLGLVCGEVTLASPDGLGHAHVEPNGESVTGSERRAPTPSALRSTRARRQSV